jgi:MFS family permease
VFSLALFGVGLAALIDAFGTVGGSVLVQRSTPDEIRARVFGSLSGIGWTANAIAFVVAGFLLEAIGPRWVYAVGASIGAVGAVVLAMLLRPLRDRDAAPPGPVSDADEAV